MNCSTTPFAWVRGKGRGAVHSILENFDDNVVLYIVYGTEN